MATWLAHLRIAEALVGQFGFDEGAFYAGNIGADCGLPTENGFQPPKEVTHWAAHKSECDYMRFKAEYIDCERDPLRLSFYWGYFAHLMTDCLWSTRINAPTKERFSALYAADRKEFYRLVKRDWYDNDFLFLEVHTDYRPLAVLRNAVLPNDLLPYYKDDNIAVQQRNIYEFYMSNGEQVFYDGKRTDIHREYPYLTAQQYELFISTTARQISAEITKYCQKVDEAKN